MAGVEEVFKFMEALLVVVAGALRVDASVVITATGVPAVCGTELLVVVSGATDTAAMDAGVNASTLDNAIIAGDGSALAADSASALCDAMTELMSAAMASPSTTAMNAETWASRGLMLHAREEVMRRRLCLRIMLELCRVSVNIYMEGCRNFVFVRSR